MSGDNPFYFPKKYFYSSREGRHLYYNGERGVCVVVNRPGSDILGACNPCATLDEVMQRLSPAAGCPDIVRDKTGIFLEKMLEAQFLTTQPPLDMFSAVHRAGASTVKLNDVYLHVTDACNARCLYCYNANQRQKTLKEQRMGMRHQLTSGQVCALFDEIAGCGAKNINFTGGEPLMRPDLFELAQAARPKGFSLSLLSNGTLIDADKAKKIAGFFDSVIISFDSCVKSEYELLSPGASFEKAVAGITHLVEAGARKLSLRPVITRHNTASLPALAEFAVKRWPGVYFLPALYLPNKFSDARDFELVPDPEDYFQVLDEFRARLTGFGAGVASDDVPLEAYGSCGAGGNGVISIGPEGSVYPCQCLHRDEFECGNIREKSLSWIIAHSPVLKAFRSEREAMPQVCAQCGLVSLCCSSCRFLRKEFEHSEKQFLMRMCPFFKREIEKRLWLEAGRQTNKTVLFDEEDKPVAV